MSSENNNEYDHIDFRINILYDAVYSNSPSQYIFNPIVKSAIKLDDIKVPDEFDYKHIFDTEFEFINKYNNKLHYKRNSETSHSCTIAFGRYHGMGNVNDLGRGELYNPAVHYLLSELVINEKFRHILLPIMFFDITLGELKNIKPEIHDAIINDPTLNNNAIDQSKIQVFATEHYFKMQSLREYVKENYENMNITHWKVIIFQVFYTLYKISERLQKFRHNWLNLDSIRVYLKQEGGKTQYKMGQTLFEIPNVGIEIKITDFTFSTTSDYIRNKDTRLIQENPYYDVHYFISHIYLYLMKEYGSVPENLMKFISEMIPSRFLPNTDEQFDGLNEQEFDTTSSFTIVPSHVLRKNIFFNEFVISDQSRQIKRQPLPNNEEFEDSKDSENLEDVEISQSGGSDESDNYEIMSVSPIQNAQIKVSNLEIKEDGIDYISVGDNNSITDNTSENPRMLARQISKSFNKKKSEQYYNKDMIKGSRKIISGFDSDTISESGIFKKAENKMARNKSKKTDSDEVPKKKKSKKQMKRSSREDKGWEGTVETIKLSDTETDSKFNSTRQAERILAALEELNGKNRSKKSKKLSSESNGLSETSEASISSVSKSSEKSHSDTTISESSKSSKPRHKKSSKHSKPSKSYNLQNNGSDNEINNINSNLHKIDSAFAKKLENAPMGLMTVPDHILNQLEAGNHSSLIDAMGGPQIPQQPHLSEGIGFDPMMQHMNPMNNMMQPSMMPQMQGYPMNQMGQMGQMGQMMQQPMMPQMQGYQMGQMGQMGQMPQMGLEQMFQSMQGQGNMGQDQMGLGLPMMPMMGGGAKKEGMYCFGKDGQKIDNFNKDFFF